MAISSIEILDPIKQYLFEAYSSIGMMP